MVELSANVHGICRKILSYPCMTCGTFSMDHTVYLQSNLLEILNNFEMKSNI